MALRSLPLTLLLLLFLRALFAVFIFWCLPPPSLLSVRSPSDMLSMCVVTGSLSVMATAPSCCSSVTGVAEGVNMEMVEGEVGLSPEGVV